MSSSPVACNRSHATFNPPMDVWRCPHCTGGCEVFYIDESVNEDCPQLHKNDCVVCTRCVKTWTGQQIATILQKQHQVVPCPHCQGRGYIKQES